MMPRSIIALLLTIGCFTYDYANAIEPAQTDLRLRHMLSVPVIFQSEDAVLTVLNLYQEEAKWYVFTESHAYPLTITPNSMAIVANIQRSSDGQYLALVSVGEGHPILDVVELDEIVQWNRSQDIPTIVSINPYPGFINIVKWDNTTLIIESDRLLTYRQDDNFPIGLNDVAQFRLQPVSGVITALSKHAQSPVDYFIAELAATDEWRQMEAAIALALLGGKQALPLLRTLASHDSSTHVQHEAKQAVKILTCDKQSNGC